MAGKAESTIERIADAITSPKTLRLLLTSALIASLVAFSVVTSAVASLTFYNILIPPVSLSTPVFLQYGSGIPYAKLKVPEDVRGSERYNVYLDIEAPGSRRNIELGNFMVSMTLLTSAGQTVDYSSRPASLEEPSVLLYLTKDVLGFRRKQRLRVLLFEHFQPKKVKQVELSVGRPDAELHVYKTFLVFDAHFRGFKYLMHQHRILSFAALSTTFFFWEFISALLIWVFFFRKSTPAIDTQPAMNPSDDRKPTAQELQEALKFSGSGQKQTQKAENLAEGIKQPHKRGILDDADSATSVLDAMLKKQATTDLEEPIEETDESFDEAPAGAVDEDQQVGSEPSTQEIKKEEEEDAEAFDTEESEAQGRWPGDSEGVASAAKEDADTAQQHT